MSNSDPFWMVVHWLSTSPAAPYIGMDSNWPVDSASYWYWSNEGNQPGWHAWLSYDFMMRVLTSPQIGAVEQNPGNAGVFAFLAPRPNPFRQRTELTFTIPRDGRLDIRMYDVTGRMVLSRKEPVQAGMTRMLVSDRDDQNRALASGIYFLNAAYEGRSMTRKVILIKE
jgi:hypothetical protein